MNSLRDFSFIVVKLLLTFIKCLCQLDLKLFHMCDKNLFIFNSFF